MFRRLTLSAAAIAALVFAGQASALIITSGGNVAGDGSGLTTSQDGAIVETFDGGGENGSGGFVQGWTWTQSDASPHIVSGDLSGVYAAPYQNETNYYSVAENVPGWAQVDFGSAFNYLGLYWGSIDDYNTIHLLNGETIIQSITGSQALPPANGDQGPDGSAYINLFSEAAFTGAVFESSQYAFEFDNLAVARVSEPGTLGLLGAGLAAFGLMARRRRRD